MRKLLLLLAAIFIIGGCSAHPSELSDKLAKEFATKMKYVRDTRTDDLCFGVVASRQGGNASQRGLAAVCVPCEKVDHLLVN